MANKTINEGIHECSEAENYIYPKEAEVRANLEKFQDMKLGFLTHFGAYSQMGIMESWPIVDDQKQSRWSQKDVDWFDDDNIEKFKEQYWNLNKSFNPVRFEADRFAASIANLGFKYAVIPTKHHDGFCMWDTKETDYKVTNEECPFHVNPNADIYGSLITELEKQGLTCGAYFSKPDFYSNYYWTDEFRYGTNATRSVAYDISKEPERWEMFKEYTEKQMTEVISNYGKVDILWLDGGQVIIQNNEDIKLDEIVSRLRKINPGLIVVDRIAGTSNENYLTPEVKVLDSYVPVPWESCIPAGKHFSHRYEDVWKTPAELARIFVQILCKGGNLLLNIPTQPDGRMPKAALKNVGQFTDWVKEHEYAIFGSRPYPPYIAGQEGLVKGRDGKIYLFHPGRAIATSKIEYISIPIDFKSISYKNEKCEVRELGSVKEVKLPSSYWDVNSPLYFVFEIEV